MGMVTDSMFQLSSKKINGRTLAISTEDCGSIPSRVIPKTW